MNVDGKQNIKEKIKIFENEKYITYEYVFENGNRYRETVTKWTQKDLSRKTKQSQEDILEKQLDKLVHRR